MIQLNDEGGELIMPGPLGVSVIVTAGLISGGAIVNSIGNSPETLPDGCSEAVTVERGESWSLIADRYDMSADELAKINDTTIEETVHPKDMICTIIGQPVVGVSVSLDSSSNEVFVRDGSNCLEGSSTYAIKIGDGPYNAANYFGMSLESVYDANPGLEGSTVHSGNIICSVVDIGELDADGAESDESQPNSSEESVTSSAITSNASSSQEISSVSNNNCKYAVYDEKKVARLLGATNQEASELCRQVYDFQRSNGLYVDGIVGNQTALQLIRQSENPCSVLGWSNGNSCFLGVQTQGHTGILMVVIDGEVRDEFYARFGNPNKKNKDGENIGGYTDEGVHSIYKTKDGWHKSTNCDDECMYEPIFFNGGEAIHGTNGTFEAGSLGCVGVTPEDMDEVDSYYNSSDIDSVVIDDLQR